MFRLIGLTYFLLASMIPHLAIALPCNELLNGLPHHPTELAQIMELLPASTQHLINHQLPPPHPLIDHSRVLYVRSRGNNEYVHELPPSFEQYRASLPPNSIWIDVGPGVQRAQAQYDSHAQGLTSPKLELIGVGLKNPIVLTAKFALLHPIEWWASRRLTFVEAPIERIPAPLKQHLITERDRVLLFTDVSSALAYSTDFRATLQAELEHLAPGGRLYTNFHPQDVEFFGRKTSSQIDFMNWLNRCKGFRVIESFKNTHTSDDYILGGLTIERTGDPLIFPHLVVAYTDHGFPPQRVLVSLDF